MYFDWVALAFAYKKKKDIISKIILLTITVHCSSIRNWKLIFYLHHAGVSSKFSQGCSCSFLFKNKLEGSPWWSVPSCRESLSLVLMTHLLGIPHSLCIYPSSSKLTTCSKFSHTSDGRSSGTSFFLLLVLKPFMGYAVNVITPEGFLEAGFLPFRSNFPDYRECREKKEWSWLFHLFLNR